MMKFDVTKKEITAAKKIIYTSDDKTKKTFLIILGALVYIYDNSFYSKIITFLVDFFACIIHFKLIWDSWYLGMWSRFYKSKYKFIDFLIYQISKEHDYICKELRKAVNCQTVSGPIKVSLSINYIMNTIK